MSQQIVIEIQAKGKFCHHCRFQQPHTQGWYCSIFLTENGHKTLLKGDSPYTERCKSCLVATAR